MKPVISVADAREILALVPYQIGYPPRDSAVMISLRGPRQRVGVMARVDGDEFISADAPEVMASITDFLCRDGADRVLVALYYEGDRKPPWIDQIPVLLSWYQKVFMNITIWWVNGDHYRQAAEVLPDDPQVTWGDLRPIGDLTATEVSATMVMNGAVIKPNRKDLAQLPTLSSEVARRRWSSGDRWWRERSAKTTRDRWRTQSTALWSNVLDGVVERTHADKHGIPDLADQVWGKLGVSLGDRLVRDQVIGLLIERAVADPAAVAAQIDKDKLRSLMEVLIDAEDGAAPRGKMLDQLNAVLTQAVVSTRAKYQKEGLSILALLAWWECGGARARELVKRVLESNPEHRLSLLVSRMLDTGFAPGWVAKSSQPAAS